MKTIKTISLLIFLVGFLSVKSYGASSNWQDTTITSDTITITSSCTIDGNLVILNNGILNVDFTDTAADTFVVRGNILLQGNAILRIHGDSNSTGDQFIVSNSFSSQRMITTQDSSKIQMEFIEFRTQEGDLSNAASIYMNYSAEGSSIFYINKSWLDPQKAWLLCDIKNKSTLIGYEPNRVPTEIYVQDTAQIVLHGPTTDTGLWLKFESITDTLTLPFDQANPFNWQIGRGFGGLNTQWYLEVDTAKPGLGVQLFPTAKMHINGMGTATKELTVALLFANGTDTLKNLTVGLQNTTIANGINGSITLNNVNLGPIAWQLYPLMNENLFIKNSIVNEIGVAGPSNVVVDSSLLQLAVLATMYQGSAMTINNSEIWNQAITASNNSSITLNNCNVTGSAFSTTDTSSHITVNGGCFLSNPSGCTPNTMINWTTGQPYCNPFISSGFPQILTPATIALNGVNNSCTTTVEDLNKTHNLIVYPNPSHGIISVSSDRININTIEVYNVLGKRIYKSNDIQKHEYSIDLSNQSKGVYFIKVDDGKKIYNKKIMIQ